MLNLDTHILIHALNGNLKPREQRLLSDDPWGVSAIVLWELAKLVQIGRLELDLDGRAMEKILSTIHVWPIDLKICRTLKKLDFKSDPADELIAATSIAHGVPLLTRDKTILKSKVTPLA